MKSNYSGTDILIKMTGSDGTLSSRPQHETVKKPTVIATTIPGTKKGTSKDKK